MPLMQVVLRELLVRPADAEVSTADLQQTTGLQHRSLYPQLRRLQDAGWVRSWKEDQAQIEGRGAERYFRLVPEARAAAERMVADGGLPWIRDIRAAYDRTGSCVTAAYDLDVPVLTVRSLLTSMGLFVETPESAIVDLYRQCGTLREVRDRWGGGLEQIKAALERAGIEPLAREMPPSLPSPQELVERYRAEGSIARIARSLHVHPRRVRQELVDAGVDLSRHGKKRSSP